LVSRSNRPEMPFCPRNTICPCTPASGCPSRALPGFVALSTFLAPGAALSLVGLRWTLTLLFRLVVLASRLTLPPRCTRSRGRFCAFLSSPVPLVRVLAADHVLQLCLRIPVILGLQ
ncbi:hypothetical protein Vafri_2863, partial [Volvox africanus]